MAEMVHCSIDLERVAPVSEGRFPAREFPCSFVCYFFGERHDRWLHVEVQLGTKSQKIAVRGRFAWRSYKSTFQS